MRKYLLIILIFICTGFSNQVFAGRFDNNVVSITVTRQGYDYRTPWQKSSIEKELISGTVIEGKRILVLSYKLANHVLLEVSKYGSNRKFPAKVILKDYHCGLALIQPEDDSFFNDLKPVKLDYNKSSDGSTSDGSTSDGSIKNDNVNIVRWNSYGILKAHPAEYSRSSVEYLQSAGVILNHYMNSDIDTAGRGEPVFAGNKLVGITLWHFTKSKLVKVIDTDVITRMFKDLDNGEYEGLPSFELEDVPLDNDENLRDYLGIKQTDSGVLITGITPGTSGYGTLKKGDVILNINGNNIEDNGMYQSEKYGSLNFHGIIYLNHFIGDVIKMQVVRDKKKMDIDFRLEPFSKESYLIPLISYDEQPAFYIFGGLILQEFTTEYLKTWGKDWDKKANKRLMYYYDNFKKYPTADRRRLVILSAVLPATVNIGYHDLGNLILDKVNSIKVTDLDHVKKVIEKSKDKYIKLEFIGNYTVVLNREQAVESINDIMRKYNIHRSFSL
ncbi:MAG: hypothetical protein JW864_06870 [Spirochaetes bacterium]|nr:hypothetical protein [Spirochaetota bacterium]